MAVIIKSVMLINLPQTEKRAEVQNVKPGLRKHMKIGLRGRTLCQIRQKKGTQHYEQEMDT